MDCKLGGGTPIPRAAIEASSITLLGGLIRLPVPLEGAPTLELFVAQLLVIAILVSQMALLPPVKSKIS